MSDEAYDERTGELDIIQASYSDECILTSSTSGYVELAVTLNSPLQLLSSRWADTSEQQQHLVLHLPPVRIAFTLPDTYPETTAPDINLKSTPSWLPDDLKLELENAARSL